MLLIIYLFTLNLIYPFFHLKRFENLNDKLTIFFLSFPILFIIINIYYVTICHTPGLQTDQITDHFDIYIMVAFFLKYSILVGRPSASYKVIIVHHFFQITRGSAASKQQILSIICWSIFNIQCSLLPAYLFPLFCPKPWVDGV